MFERVSSFTGQSFRVLFLLIHSSVCTIFSFSQTIFSFIFSCVELVLEQGIYLDVGLPFGQEQKGTRIIFLIYFCGKGEFDGAFCNPCYLR